MYGSLHSPAEPALGARIGAQPVAPPGAHEYHVLTDVLARVGNRWTITVITLLGERSTRFNELRRGIAGVSQRMLTRTLRALERDGLVARSEQATRPPSVEYSLTERGRSLGVHLSELSRWARAHHGEVARSRTHYDARFAPPQRS